MINYFICSSLPGYMFSCIEKLALHIPQIIVVVETSNNKNYPIKFQSKYFNITNYEIFMDQIRNTNFSNVNKVFVAGWANNKIIELADYFYFNKVNMILLSDQAKKGNLKQYFGKFLLKRYLNKFEIIVVPGHIGYELMIYYGIDKKKIIQGLYSSNNKHFNEARLNRLNLPNYPKSFLFDGQYIKRKGVRFLINEYSNYKKESNDPWSLIMIGKGEMEKIIPSHINNLGFIKQDYLTDIYSNAGCFVLPSYEDHWPLVVHQATSAGLPLLVSPYCGNHYELFISNKNGFFIDPNIKGSLKNAMLKIEQLSSQKLKEMGDYSFELSQAFTVDKWVKLFKDLIDN